MVVPLIPLLILLFVASVLGVLTWTGQMADFRLFARAGNDLLAGRWSEVFADPQLQAGPVVLVVSAVLDRLGGPPVLAVAGLPVVTLLTYLGVGRLRADHELRRRPAVQLVAATALLLWEAGEGGIHSGHLSQLAVPALWLAAGSAARRDHAVTAGGLLALASGCETWGVLALPVLLLADGPRRRTASAAAVVGVLVLYLPFVLTGGFRMFDFHWFMSTETIYGQLAPHLFDQLSATGFPWWARCFQAIVAMTGCAAIVLAARTDSATTWTAPLAAVLARLVLDPVGMNYYWTAVVVLLIAGAVTAPAGRATVAVLACWWQFFPVAHLWFATLLVTVPLLLLVLTLPGRNTDRAINRWPSTGPAGPPASRPAERGDRSSA